jgi:hypothetical protein
MIGVTLGAAMLGAFCAAMVWFGYGGDIRLNRRSEGLLTKPKEELARLLVRKSDLHAGAVQAAPAHFRKG